MLQAPGAVEAQDNEHQFDKQKLVAQWARWSTRYSQEAARRSQEAARQGAAEKLPDTVRLYLVVQRLQETGFIYATYKTTHCQYPDTLQAASVATIEAPLQPAAVVAAAAAAGR